MVVIIWLPNEAIAAPMMGVTFHCIGVALLSWQKKTIKPIMAVTEPI